MTFRNATSTENRVTTDYCRSLRVVRGPGLQEVQVQLEMDAAAQMTPRQRHCGLLHWK